MNLLSFDISVVQVCHLCFVIAASQVIRVCIIKCASVLPDVMSDVRKSLKVVYIKDVYNVMRAEP